MLMFSLYAEFYNVMSATHALKILPSIWELNTGYPWDNCTHPKASSRCVRVRSDFPSCDVDNKYIIAAHDYVRSTVYRLFDERDPNYTEAINWDLMGIVVVLWALIALLAYQGILRYHKVATIIVIVDVCYIVFLIIIINLFGYRRPGYEGFEHDENSFFTNQVFHEGVHRDATRCVLPVCF